MRVRVRPTHKTLFMRVDFPGRRRREGQRWDPSAAHPVRVSFSGSTSRTCSSTIGCLVFVSTRNRVTSFFPGASSCSQLRPVDPPQSPRACRCRGVPDWQVRVCDRGVRGVLERGGCSRPRFAHRLANNRPFTGLALEGSLFANPSFSRLPEVGVEPTRHCWQRILSPPRLPFRHSGSRARKRPEILRIPAPRRQPPSRCPREAGNELRFRLPRLLPA